MGKRRWLLALVAAGCAATLHVGVASAQVTVQVNQDGSPASGVNLSLMLNGIKTTRGATGSDGQARIEEPAIAAGAQVEVVVRTCDGELSEVIHVPPNEALPKDERCDDDPAGAYRWGENPEIVVDWTPGGPVLTFPEPGLRRAWTLGASVDFLAFPNLEDRVCDQPNVMDCTVDDTTVGFSAFTDVRIHPNLAVGALYSYATTSLDQHYMYAGAHVSRESDLILNTLQAYARPVLSLTPRFDMSLVFGWGWVWNHMTSMETGPGGDTADFDRDESGGRILLGWEADWFPTDRVGARAGVSHTSGGTDDADAKWSFTIGIRFREGKER